MEVYLDVVVLLNFLVDFLLILGTNRLSGHAPAVGRAAGAAAIGAIYAALCLLPGWKFLGGIVWRTAALAAMALVAFGYRGNALRRGVLFVFLSMALGGIALGIGNGGFWAIVMAALGVAVLCVVGFCGNAARKQYLAVLIEHGNLRLRLTALLDTGNTLRDPVTGTPVLITDAETARQLLGLTAQELLHPVDTLARRGNCGLRLIPYSAVGQPHSMLLGTRVDRLEINGKREDMIVAFAPQNIGKTYQALAGGNVA